jgi:L-lactate dehydrogenase complex protein LldF
VSQELDRRAARELGPQRWPLHDRRVFAYRDKRDRAAAAEPDFAALRAHATALKAHVLDHLERYLERFEAEARAAGAVVHWAEDADEFNALVCRLLEQRGARRVVKSKSMLTEECGLNPYLEARGIEVVDTDLGERIVQLAHEPPSHIILPAIHKSAAEIGRLFEGAMGGEPGETDPERLTRCARRDLRSRFLGAQAAITGVNFAVAETGSLVICTNEGNADLGMSLPPLHIACMGIEKLVPTLADLAVPLRLLARSATGQAITTYTSVVTGPRPGAELHIALVDNGRSRLLADTAQRAALACIRCGACLNTCPVYRRAGGHAYGRALPGPIGAVLAPAQQPGRDAAALPLASTLCGSCSEVCPVGIDLHGQLLAWRATAATAPGRGGAPRAAGPLRRAGLRLLAAVLRRRWSFRLAGRALRWAWPALSRRWPGNPAGAWLAARELPAHPGPSFARLYRRRVRGGAGRRP